MLILKSDKYKYIICTYPKSGCTVLRLLHLYLNKDDNEVLDYKFEDKHHELDTNIFNINDPIYDEYHKVVVYRNPYERLCSIFYQKICGVMSENIKFENKLIEQPCRLTDTRSTFNKWVYILYKRKVKDMHFEPQSKHSFKFDETLEISNIQEIFKQNKELNKLVNSLMEQHNINHRNSMHYYELPEFRDLSNYDFFKDEDKLIKEFSVPHCKYLLTQEMKNIIKNNYRDDFFE